LVSVVNYPNWLTFTRPYTNENDYSRVIIYVNIRLFSFCFSFWKDVIDDRDILLISFFNKGKCFWMMNIYSDFLHTVVKYLKDTEVNICNLLVITSDFNIWDNLWNPSFPHHSSLNNDLIIIADSFNLNLSCSINQVPTRYSDNDNDSNLVIDLMFLWCGSSELNNHSIHPDWHLTSDHAPLSITIPIAEENIDLHKRTIKKIAKRKNCLSKK